MNPDTCFPSLVEATNILEFGVEHLYIISTDRRVGLGGIRRSAVPGRFVPLLLQGSLVTFGMQKGRVYFYIPAKQRGFRAMATGLNIIPVGFRNQGHMRQRFLR